VTRVNTDRATLVKFTRAEAALASTPARVATFDAIAAELRKSCAGCRWWMEWQRLSGEQVRECGRSYGPERMPFDGSGYCRPGWEAK